jgi:hypothetical protein
VAVVVGGCGHCTPTAGIRLDRSPRFPTDQGVVTEVSVKRITLDGRRRYSVSPRLLSFSTYDLSTVPLLQRRGQYVEIGAKGRTMVWIAAIAAIVPGPPRAVYYTGTLVRVEGRRAIFSDGTVFELSPEVVAPTGGGFVIVQLDTETHRVVQLKQP